MDPNVWHLLSLAYYSGGSFKEARECFDRGKHLLDQLKARNSGSMRASPQLLVCALRGPREWVGAAYPESRPTEPSGRYPCPRIL